LKLATAYVLGLYVLGSVQELKELGREIGKGRARFSKDVY